MTLSLYFSKENADIILNPNKPLIIGNKNLSAIVTITEERKIVKELYVVANAGFLVAIIIEHIIGRYESTNIQDVFIETIASFKTRTNE